MPKYLQQRYRVWYAVLDIPKDVRPKLGGKPRFVQSLKTESQSEAEILVLPVIAEWKALINEARGKGRPSKPDLVVKALQWRDELRIAQDDETERFSIEAIVDDELWKLHQEDPEAAALAAKISDGKSYPLDRDIEAWLATQQLVPKTLDMKRSTAQTFARRFKFSHEVTRKSLLNWVHAMQIDEGSQPSTVRRIISTCRGYWDYLHVVGHLQGQENIFDKVSPKKATKTKAAALSLRQPFHTDDLPRLLNGALNCGDFDLARLIWMAIWTGCRIEELCSLGVKNVHQDHFTVEDAKTRAGHREVPVHPRLAPLLNHLCATTSDGYVISGLSFNKYGDRSNAIGKRFGRLKTSLGFDDRYVFHSLRKTVTTELENAGVPENVAADIVGHEKKTMTYGLYSKGNRLDVLQKAIRKLAYKIPPALDRKLVNPEAKH